MAHIDLPELCEALRSWYPEMGQRVIASVGDDITAENMPSLPLINLALSKVSALKSQYRNGVNARLELYDDMDIEFWQEPLRLKRADKTESPFWTYYPFHNLMADLLSRLAAFAQSRGAAFEFAGAEIAAAPYAVIISFHIRQHFALCLTDEMPAQNKLSQERADGSEIMLFSQKICARPAHGCPPPCAEELPGKETE